MNKDGYLNWFWLLAAILGFCVCTKLLKLSLLALNGRNPIETIKKRYMCEKNKVQCILAWFRPDYYPGYRHIGRHHRCRVQVAWKRLRCESDSSTGASSSNRFIDKNMVVWCTRIPFFGNIIGADGAEPDPDKVTVICNMTAPTDVKELHIYNTFVGLENYLGRFTSSPSYRDVI